jgi:hypothetical protein
MALVKYGGGITAMSGSTAGNTFARNRFGNYVRARTKPVNPRSQGQSLMRLIIGYLTEAWHEELSDSDRAKWATYANAITMKNRLGENMKCTGFNHFIRANSVICQKGDAAIEPGPTELSLPQTDPTFAIALNAAMQQIAVTFDNTLDWSLETGSFMSLFMGKPQIATRNFFNGPWRLTGHIDGDPGIPTSPATITPVFPLIAGQKVWLAGRIIRNDGRASMRFTAQAIVPLAGTILSVAGTLVPDSVGIYPADGALAGKASYRRTDGNYYLWYNADDSTSYISILKGDKGVGYWSKAGNPVAGSYTHGGTATGDATVASN